MDTYHNLTVIVTRPAHQAQTFADELSARGAKVVRLPTIQISFRTQPLSALEQTHLAKSTLWVFTSANAVAGAASLGVLDSTNRPAIACIGAATARALQQRGIEPDHVPMDNNSEGLLNHLHNLPASSVLTIVRGGAGREKLQQAWSAQGHKVNMIDTYQREMATPEDACVLSAVNALPCVISVTSNKGLLNLMEIIPKSYYLQLFNSSLALNSDRCARLARELGFIGKIVVANPPGDNGQLHAVEQLALN